MALTYCNRTFAIVTMDQRRVKLSCEAQSVRIDQVCVGKFRILR